MGLTELKRVKQLEDENRRLKSLVADLTHGFHRRAARGIQGGRRVVYRKEQFDEDFKLPAELIICDRRYRRSELLEKFAAVGIKDLDCRYVRAGRWDEELDPTHDKAKEILFLGERE